MEKYSKEFISLNNCFREIQAYSKGSSIDIEKCAQLFFFELSNVDIQYQVHGNRLLSDKEMIAVQKYICRITGNRNLSKAIRRKILEESLDFNEIVEIRRREVSCDSTVQQ